MSFVIEDGYNTAYISMLFMILFYDKSMIERYILMETYSDTFNGLYLQKIIYHNFVKQIRNNLCVTSSMLNEIRLCSVIHGWNNDSAINIMCSEHNPIEYLNFILKTIKFSPIELDKRTASDYDHFMVVPTVKSSIQDTYNAWSINNKICNIPIFVIFKLNNIKSAFKINKKIFLFPKTHQYSNIKWIFHGLFYKENKHSPNYKTIINKESKLISFNQNDYPNVKQLDSPCLNGLTDKIVYVIYRKEPTI